MKKSLFIALTLITASQVSAGNLGSQTYQKLSCMNNNIRTGLGQHLANQRAANMGLKTNPLYKNSTQMGDYTNYGIEGITSTSQVHKPFFSRHSELMDDFEQYRSTAKTTPATPSLKQPTATESLDDGYSYFGV